MVGSSGAGVDKGKGAGGGAPQIMKLFVSNLPDGSTPWELTCFMQRFGDVWKSYVAKKRDKAGKRFGFVSFKYVRDGKELVTKINGVSMGGCKLMVNVARFAVENNGLERESERNMKGDGESERLKSTVGLGAGSYSHEGQKSFAWRGGRSFRDVVGFGAAASELRMGGSSPEKVVSVPDDISGCVDLFRKAVVGRTVDLDTLVFFDRLLRIGKVKFVKIQFLGGLSIMVSFESSEEAESFLQNKKLWGPWFSNLDLWEGQTLAVERVAWIRVQGLPLHLVDSEILRKIGEAYGKILYVPMDVGEESDLSFQRVAVLAGNDARIKEFLCIKWKDKSFRVWVMEEEEVWVPDCLKTSMLDGGSSETVKASTPEEVMETSGSNCHDLEVEQVVNHVEEKEDPGEVVKSARQSPVKSPAGGNKGSYSQAAPVISPVDEQSSLHGDTNRPSDPHCMDVGPEKYCHEERENGCFVFNVADNPRKFKRRPFIRSPSKERMNLDQSSPLVDGRVKKRPRPSDSDPFDLDRFINRWNILSEASRLEEERIQGTEGRVPDLNRRACSTSKETATGDIGSGFPG
ncbi:putative RNA recognition motif domain, nucleotide-binding alpha-beta plait domain superfamily [Helianthus annuus]|nr:putative RNA recognition motif domain, nucleotide-binding alpha-beta plait domain superfamily [Helianthus annuus]